MYISSQSVPLKFGKIELSRNEAQYCLKITKEHPDQLIVAKDVPQVHRLIEKPTEAIALFTEAFFNAPSQSRTLLAALFLKFFFGIDAQPEKISVGDTASENGAEFYTAAPRLGINKPTPKAHGAGEPDAPAK